MAKEEQGEQSGRLTIRGRETSKTHHHGKNIAIVMGERFGGVGRTMQTFARYGMEQS